MDLARTEQCRLPNTRSRFVRNPVMACVLSLFIAAGVFTGMAGAQTTSVSAKQVATGGASTCAVTVSGGVKCWGFNQFGQLGDGTTTNRALGADVSGLTAGVAAVTGGVNSHTCALTSGGGVKCWGYNSDGQLGDNTGIDRSLPVNVVGLASGITAIAPGGYHTCALTAAGGAKCWGSNGRGQVGNNDPLSTPRTPVDVFGLTSGVVAIGAGSEFSCALTANQGVKCWGNNLKGQLGDGTLTPRNAPVDVVGLTSGAAAISVGYEHACALTISGGVKCWGGNLYGALGDNTTTNRSTPVDVSGLSPGVTNIAAGGFHTCAIVSGAVKCWGLNNQGQLGDGSTTQRGTPIAVTSLTFGAAAISTGGNHSCALTIGGGVKCWGFNLFGQLGDGTTANRLTPVDVVGFAAGAVTPPPQTQVIGGINLGGNAGGALLVRSPDLVLRAGRLVNNQFQFTPIADPGVNFRIVGAVDLNKSGKADLIFQDITQGEFGDVSVWPGFNASAQFLLRKVKRVWDVQAVGDLDGDGFGDLVWRYTVVASPDTGVSYIWFTNGRTVTQVRKRGGAPVTWTLLGAADLNGDGAADMVYLSPDNNLRVLMATPNRTCANLSAGAIPAGFTALKFGDFTGSGRGDVLIRNSTTGQVQLLSLSAAGLTLPIYAGAPDDQNASCTASTLVVSNLAGTLPAIIAGWQFYAAGDFNGDGILDLVWVQPDGTLTVWLMQANGAAPIVIANAGAAPFFTAVSIPPVSGGDLYSAVTAKAKADFLAQLPIACAAVQTLPDGAKNYSKCLENNTTPAINISALMWFGGLPFQTGSSSVSGPTDGTAKVTYGSGFNDVAIGDSCAIGIVEPFIPALVTELKGVTYAGVVGKPFNFNGTVNDAISLNSNGRVVEYTMTNANGYKLEMHPNLTLFDPNTSGSEGILGSISGTSFTAYFGCTK